MGRRRFEQSGWPEGVPNPDDGPEARAAFLAWAAGVDASVNASLLSCLASDRRREQMLLDSMPPSRRRGDRLRSVRASIRRWERLLDSRGADRPR